MAGTARGRRLEAPPGIDTRPTSDRVREAIFNALHSLDAIVDRRVADLFAGSGALGIEALSRGAASCTFVEQDRTAIAVIEANLARCGLVSGTVVRADVLRWLAGSRGPLDLVLADPPYAFDDWPTLLGALDTGLAVLESNRPIEPGPGWLVTRSKHYGGTVVTFVARAAQL
ncbi:MAG: 16S rRNA (guanine(966)-N(2))-methyltransferase RsmD [Actinobacteria bacterium]|nr:MAG: 16S rRNA (guanine(966)-N(2))-methyltransferase RsmD [Actinomycetota bacterium]